MNSMEAVIDVHVVKRLVNTANGNPRWKITYTEGESTTKRYLLTKPDTMDAAKLREFAGPGTFKVRVLLNPRGWIIGWNEVPRA